MMPVSVSVEENVLSLISQRLDTPLELISAASGIVNELKADSLDVVELIMAIEDEFEIKIPNEDHDYIQEVGDLIDYVESRC